MPQFMIPGYKRLAVIAAGVVGAIAIGVAVMSWLVNREAVREAIAAQIRNATGLELTMGERAAVSVFPTGAVSFHDVRLNGDDGERPALVIEELTARLGLLPLMFRRYEIADLTLTRPRFQIIRRDGGATNWDGIVATLARAFQPGHGRQAVVSEIRISDGTLRYADDARATSETLTGIDLSLAWPSISRSFAATGQMRWRNMPVDASLTFGDLNAAIAGKPTSVKARLSNPSFKFAFDGVTAARPRLALEGTLSADAPSLREVLRWSGHEPPGNAGFRRFALKARTNVANGIAALSDVNLELDGNVAEGALNYVMDERQSLQGTLAADRLDLSPYLGALQLLSAGTRDWNRQPFDLRLLGGIDLDLRLSAARATLGATKLGRMALATNLRDGTLTMSVGEAQMLGGMLKGSFALTRTEAAADARAQFRFSDINLEPAANELFGFPRMAGRGDVNLTLQATGNSIYGLTQTLDGTISLQGRDGALNGLNIEQLLRRLERRPLSGTGDFRGGRTPFDRLVVDMIVAKGVASTRDVRIEGPTVRLVCQGTAQVPARELDLKGVASLIGGSDTAQGFELPFVVQGPWDDPIVLPDPESLIRRSPASAPLLDSVRDRNTREAVRSAIERLTGAPQPAQPAAPDAPAPEKPAPDQPPAAN
ncbi:MAG: AsmA family protein [Xanthobacteraceae bacterium]|nr:MAG: AsmA family protein [Xanthobacteraceae bacterium]